MLRTTLIAAVMLVLAACDVGTIRQRVADSEPPPNPEIRQTTATPAPVPEPEPVRPRFVPRADSELTSPHIPSIAGRRAWSGPQSAAQLDIFLTARDQRGWQILWQLIGETAPGPLPDGAMAVGVFLGPRPTGGYAVRLADLFAEEEAVFALYDETVPGPDQMVAQVITSPFAVQLLRRHPQPVHFVPLEIWLAAQQ